MTASRLSKRLGAIPIPILIAMIATLAVLDLRASFESPLLLFALNAVFVSLASFLVAYISARSYLISGSNTNLLLGSGVLAFGSASLLAGWLMAPPGGVNVNVTIHNTGSLLGSVFHAVSATMILLGVTSEVLRFRKLRLIITYLAVLVLIALLTIASLQGVIPTFFIQGEGPTSLRQGVLGTALFLFAISSIMFMKLYSESKSDLLYWYSLALAMIASGFFAIFFSRVSGSPVAWAGRCAQYVGGIYFLIAVLTTIRGARTKG